MGSCGANRMEFEDQSAIKGKFEQIGIRPIRVSYFGHFFLKSKNIERGRRRRRRRKRRRRRRRKVWNLYGNYLSMELLYGWLCFCMEFEWKCLYGY